MTDITISYEVSPEGVEIIVRNKPLREVVSRIRIPDEIAADTLQDAVAAWRRRNAPKQNAA